MSRDLYIVFCRQNHDCKITPVGEETGLRGTSGERSGTRGCGGSVFGTSGAVQRETGTTHSNPFGEPERHGAGETRLYRILTCRGEVTQPFSCFTLGMEWVLQNGPHSSPPRVRSRPRPPTPHPSLLTGIRPSRGLSQSPKGRTPSGGPSEPGERTGRVGLRVVGHPDFPPTIYRFPGHVPCLLLCLQGRTSPTGSRWVFRPH